MYIYIHIRKYLFYLHYTCICVHMCLSIWIYAIFGIYIYTYTCIYHMLIVLTSFYWCCSYVWLYQVMLFWLMLLYYAINTICVIDVVFIEVFCTSCFTITQYMHVLMRMPFAQEHPVVLQLGGSDPAAWSTSGWDWWDDRSRPPMESNENSHKSHGLW